MKKLNAYFLMLMMGLGLFTACEDDTVDPDNDVTITGIPATASIENLGTLSPVTATITAPDGLTSLVVTKDGESFDTKDFDGKQTSGTYEFTYTATAGDEDKNLVFVFKATDANGDTEEVNHILSVGEAPEIKEPVTKAGLITENETWTNDRFYILSGKVVVTDGVTLTIQPGTIIKSKRGEGSLASALVVARGGRLMAEGTAEAPIIFTSELDNIHLGQKAGTNLDETQRGLWGGVIILGKAPISADGAEVQVEGLPADQTYGLYGGNVPDDNSGSIKYVSIRHGGANIGEGNEINGLTLGGVGSATVVENIEVIANDDDGIEWFGGTVNVKNALVWGQKDDAYDIDQAWSGTLDNFIYLAGATSDHAFEIDGAEGASEAGFMVMNGTLKGNAENTTGEFADFRDGAMGTLKDLYFFNFGASADIELDADGSQDPNDATKKLSDNPEVSDNFTAGEIVLTGLQFAQKASDGSDRTIGSIFADKWSLASSVEGDNRTASDATAQAAANKAKFEADNSVVTQPTVGADASKLSWTMAAQKGMLEDLN